MTDLLIDALATFRAWRLVAKDDITEPARERCQTWAYDRAKRDVEPGHVTPVPKLVTWLTCPWCLGLYLCVGAAVVGKFLPRTYRVARDVLATSALVGLVAEAEARLHGD